MKRTVFPVLASTVALAAVSACGVGSGTGETGAAQKSVASTAALSGSITFQTWALKNEKFTPYFNDLIADFESQNPGTTVEWVDQPPEDYDKKVTSQIQSKTLPDVVNLPPDFAYQAARADALLNLDKSIADIDSTYVKGGLEGYSYRGLEGTFGLPWYLGTDVNYWNKDVLTKAGVDTATLPATFDEMVTAAKKVHDSTDGKVHLINKIPGFVDYVSAGIPLQSEDGTEFTFNTPEAAAIIDTYKAAYDAGYIPDDALYGTYAGTVSPFVKGTAAFTTGTGYYIKSLETDTPNLAPKVIASPAIGTPPLYIQGISVSSQSKNPALALAFAQFATNNENQMAFVDIAKGFLPGTTAAQDDPVFATSDGTPAGDAQVMAAQSLKTAQNMTPAVWTSEMNTFMNQQVALALTGKQSSQEALDKTVEKANSLLEN